MELRLNDKKIIRGWAFFDWANSAFALVISVAIFPAYFIASTTDTLSIAGMEINNSALFSYTISFAYLLIVVALPFLSGLADYSGRRKGFLKTFTWMGSLGCMALFLFTGTETLWIGLTAFILATIGFDGGKVFYNSYLPLIATKNHYDKVSAQGFALGYIGSVLLLTFNLVMIQYPELFGLPEGDLPVRISFITVGLWWIGFAQIPFRRLPPDHKTTTKNFIREGRKQFRMALRDLWPHNHTVRFLTSFFFYSAGVQTVLYLAATFAEKELDFTTASLIILVLIIQIVAIGGAYLFAWLSDKRGNKVAIIAMLLIWISICFMAFFIIETNHFYLVAMLVGLVMGGIQSTSRATYSKLLVGMEESRMNSYFSFYEVVEKASIVFGTFSFGLIDQLSGSMRNSMVALALYFLIGLGLLLTTKLNNHSNYLNS